jgi:hypothetical protein
MAGMETVMRILFAATACAAAFLTSSALAEDGSTSVGLPGDPVQLAVHCSAAVLAENYLVNEEGKAPVFDQTKMDEAMVAWADEAARRKGVSVDALMDDKGRMALAEDLAWKDDVRIPQVRWCLARTPG